MKETAFYVTKFMILTLPTNVLALLLMRELGVPFLARIFLGMLVCAGWYYLSEWIIKGEKP